MANFLPLTNNLTISFSAKADVSTQEYLECGIDNFSVVGTGVVSGIEKPIATSVSISPNPFQSQALLTLDPSINISLNTTLRLFDLLGREIMQQNIENNQIMLQRTNLPNGVYFFTIEQASKYLTSGKIMVQ